MPNPSPIIDLRSDTVTKPTPAMREAMLAAEVGDDVYQEDPTVNRLEELAADMVGKEAALFVPTGVMGNTIGLKLHTQHGQEIICEARSHVMNYELSMMAWFTGCLARTVPSPNGILSWAAIAAEIRSLGPHWAPTGLIEIENTHNVGGGHCYTLSAIDEICEGAHARGLAVHMDGARLFNAAIATGVAARRIVQYVDTVMFCLSKGLGAPVGSILAGSRHQIDQARLYRKRLGGGMRQAGILAAAGIYALENLVNRLAEDHENAKLLASEVAANTSLTVEGGEPSTNIVMFNTVASSWNAAQWSQALKERGVLMNPMGPHLLRAVTHYDVSRADCQAAAAIFPTLEATPLNFPTA
ncbi:MAG: GntG family PLP-dependent aldolase [Bryobacter sp.]|nr:GntG family PLP-dependent aldolase [Bryobacter sp.]